MGDAPFPRGDDDAREEATLWMIARHIVEEFSDDAGPLIEGRIETARKEGDDEEVGYWRRVRSIVTLLQASGAPGMQ